MRCPNCQIIINDKSLSDYKNRSWDENNLIAVCELLSWETNQSIEKMTAVPLSVIRDARIAHKRHNRHMDDDEELGNQEW